MTITSRKTLIRCTNVTAYGRRSLSTSGRKFSHRITRTVTRKSQAAGTFRAEPNPEVRSNFHYGIRE